MRAALRSWRTLAGKPACGLILLYHRVAAGTPDPWNLSVAPRNFAEQLEVVGTQFHVVPLSELQHSIVDSSRVPVSLTFDDGYLDVAGAAKPLLESAAIPATVFVTTGALAANRIFWWDELDMLLRRHSELGSVGSGFLWRGLDVRRLVTEPRPYAQLLHEAHRKLRLLSPSSREEAIVELRESLGSRGLMTSIEGLGRALGPKDLMALAASPLIEVGAHSVHHPVLALLSPADQEMEMLESKRTLEELMGHSVSSFAYPFGSRADYSATSMSIARRLGYERACAAFPKLVRTSTDPFQLPRVSVGDWTGEEFARRLDDALLTLA